jgi:hypothetical protein
MIRGSNRAEKVHQKMSEAAFDPWGVGARQLWSRVA